MIGLKCSQFFLFVLALYVTSADNDGPLVQIYHGLVRGTWNLSTGGRQYASFKGIPYASPPIQENRFRDPQPLAPWSGEFNATVYGASCLQYQAFSKKPAGSENCLFINVFTPNMNPRAPLPVLVFMHGGAYLFSGSASFDLAHFQDWDIVVVTFNYRIGPFGFICTEDEEAPGNAGLKDQVFALRWVQRNIKTFGGDPNSVTLAGQSSGAGSVHYHYLSPLSEGLFHRGIAFSGTALSSWNFASKPLEKTKTLASLIGCSGTKSSVIMQCLRRAYGEDIINAQVDMFGWKVRFFSLFTPTIEPVGVKNAFLTEHPYKMTKRGAMKKLPLILMSTSHNGLYPSAAYQTDATLLREIDQEWNDLASEIFIFRDSIPPNLWPAVASQIRNKYLSGKAVSQSTFADLTQALTDRLYAAGVGELARLHASLDGASSYVGRYAFRGDYSVSSLMSGNNNNYGACNGDDVLHSFKGFGLDSNSTADKAMEDLLNNMLYTYAATGVPKLPRQFKWIPQRPDSSDTNYLDIMSPFNLEMKVSSDYGHNTFWKSLGLRENENY